MIPIEGQPILTAAAMRRSTTLPSSPRRCQCRAHSTRFTIGLGSLGSTAGRAHSASSSTTPNEYTSDLAVSFLVRA